MVKVEKKQQAGLEEAGPWSVLAAIAAGGLQAGSGGVRRGLSHPSSLHRALFFMPAPSLCTVQNPGALTQRSAS